jgi:hypothetical protein
VEKPAYHHQHDLPAVQVAGPPQRGVERLLGKVSGHIEVAAERVADPHGQHGQHHPHAQS